jgi:hypothetical protein
VGLEKEEEKKEGLGGGEYLKFLLYNEEEESSLDVGEECIFT